MSLSRRAFMQATLAGAAISAAAVRTAEAALPAQVFEANSPTDAIRAALGTREMVPDERVQLTVPDRAENGDVVPISVKADLPTVQRITLVADKNPIPVIATFSLAPEVDGFLATRIKLAETCNVLALVDSGEKLHAASKPVQVLIGGCGADEGE